MKPDMMEEGCPCTGKNLDRLLQPSILLFLTQNELHGFLLVKKLGESPMFGGVYPDPSGLYRYLKKMQANGLLDSYTDPQKDAPDRTIYRITDHTNLPKRIGTRYSAGRFLACFSDNGESCCID